MNTNNLRVDTRLRIWSAAVDTPEYCEVCNTTATFSSHVINADDVCTEVHWHCDEHANTTFIAVKKQSLVRRNAVVRERHWMHIWKVGFKRCAECWNDSRVVVTYRDDNGRETEQVMYCKAHAPALTPLPSDNIEDQVRFGLGASFSVPIDESETPEDSEE